MGKPKREREKIEKGTGSKRSRFLGKTRMALCCRSLGGLTVSKTAVISTTWVTSPFDWGQKEWGIKEDRYLAKKNMFASKRTRTEDNVKTPNGGERVRSPCRRTSKVNKGNVRPRTTQTTKRVHERTKRGTPIVWLFLHNGREEKRRRAEN